MAKRKKADLPDQPVRDQIATDLDRNLLVEAAAGTGKTTCLIARMVGLLRAGKCRIETLAAVTFTRKAAAELRTRFQLALEHCARDETGIEQKRARDALNQVERCFIGTIHSFCARLLRERPVEAGLDPAFTELDEDVDFQLRQQAWREYVATLITTDDAILPELERLGLKISPATRRSHTVADDLDELGLEPAELGPAFLKYATYPDVSDWPAQPVELPNLAPCIAKLKEYHQHVKSVSLPPDPGRDRLMPKIEHLKRMIPRVDLDQPAQLMEVLEHFDVLESRAVVQKNWPGKKPQALDELNRWNVFAEGYAQPLLLKWREHRYEPVMRAIRPARDVYDRLRRERKGLNFQDLLLRSVSLLRDKPDVRRYFRRRFSHVLVDEFQDTDPIQAEVMLLLASDDDREPDWRRCRPVPGALFVVGDPKQSIYRFRRADIVTYSRVRSIIENGGGAVVSLSTNFRSSKPIVEWVNHCFDEVFPAQANAYNPAKRPLDAGRTERNDSGPNLERLDIPPGLKWPRQIADFEADRIARTIRQAIDDRWPVPRTESEKRRGVPPHAQPGDFLIIAKSRARLTIYGRKLQQYGLPHLVTGGHGLNDVPELELLRLCVSAVIRNDDPIALVAALRSPLFGISDSLLYDFRRHGGRFHYRSDIPTALPKEDAAVLCDAFLRLRTYAGDLHRMPTAAAIERIAADMGLVAHAGAGEAGNVHAGGLLKALELLRSLEGSVTASDIMTLLDRLVDGEDAHDGAVARPFSEPPVRVMNLHQCKGLEAPFVFLVDPSGESEHDVGLYIDRSSEQAKGYLPIHGRKRSQYGRPPLLAHPPGWETLATEEQKFLDAETNRLLYVAATRAGVKLVISQPQDENADAKNPWRMLAGSLKDAGPLADPRVDASPPPVPLPFEPEAWDRESSAIADRWRTVLRPSYSVQAIKEAAIKGKEKPHGAEEGGAEWGTVLHSLLETAMKHPKADLHGLALSALVSEELPIELVDQVIETVQRVIGSDLWHRARNAFRCLTEVPVMLLAHPPESGGLPTVRRGVIDLVFLEEAGWVIVDYKSERVEAMEIPKLVSYYTPQLDAYAEVWQKIVGQPVAERGIFFSHTGSYVSV